MEETESMKKLWAYLLLIVFILNACGVQDRPPEIICGSDVTWEQAIEILYRGEVWSVFQTHSLDVKLRLKDDCTYNTVEPVIDRIFWEIEKCGEACSEIFLITE